MKDRYYLLTTVHKAPIGDKNKVFVHNEYAASKQELNRRLAELALTSSDMVGASMTKICRNNVNRENKILKVAKKIIKGE